MGAGFRVALVSLTCCLIAGPALGQAAHTYKHDQFDDDIVVASGQISGTPLNVQPGFARGEAWGQLYRPDANHYPIKVLGLDMVTAAMPNGNLPSEADAYIEFWSYDDGPAPADADPFWSVHTSALFDPQSGQDGIPLTGGVAWSVDFDWDTPDNHPPMINSGNFAVIIRFDSDAESLETEWGNFLCNQALGCGCQRVAIIQDQVTTSQANLMHILSSGCAPPATVWNWANALGVTGDLILRVRAEVAGGCVPDCTDLCCGDDGCGGLCPDACGAGSTCDPDSCTCIQDPGCTDGEIRCNGEVAEECVDGAWQTIADCAAGGQECVDGACQDPCQIDCAGKDCGSDGCGGTCGDCQAGEDCVDGACVQSGGLLVTAISPDFGYDDVETDVSVTGEGFVAGATVRLGGTTLSAIQFNSAELLSATVPSGMEPGVYMLIVSNPDGDTDSLADAFEVRHREVDAGTDGGADDPGKSGGCGCGHAGPVGGGLVLLLLVALVRRRW